MSTVCGKCQRPLKDPKSIERGYGPDCWREVKAKMAKEEEDQESEEEAGMSYYWICEACGASLDPGEKCDCSRENQKTPEPAKTKGEEECKKTA